MIICKRPALPDDHLKPQKGHEKRIFETLHNEIKCVLSIKKNFNGKKESKFSHLPMVSLTVKYPFFDDSPKVVG